MKTVDDHRAIEAASLRLLDGVNSSDVDQVLSVWSDDGILMPPNHPAVRGRAAIEQYFRTVFERVRLRFVFTESEIRVDGHTAIQRLSYTAESWPASAATSKVDHGKGLHVFSKRSGAWELTMDLWNSDAPHEPTGPEPGRTPPAATG